MPLYWISKPIAGEQRYFIQEASWPIFAMLHAAIAGFPGKPTETPLELDARTARKIPKDMRGRVLSQRQAERLLKSMGG